MTHRLVPYVQDSKKWIDHYMARAMKQAKRKDLTKEYKEKDIVKPAIVLPTMQMVAQAESEMWHEKEEKPIFEPIKVTPSFNSTSHSKTSKVETSKKRKRKGTSKPTNKQKLRDIFA